ncbi:hypothetical protein LSM04_004007 [Trypanosoma melophagium]|uniref:uncharacterized protein n=1 Tax=Trypanosoma melophagium TaxID=715481 RepID=UPI00351A453F|nr:hypothetical protein LSM04_004007 [Trypanosoma melophagium]
MLETITYFIYGWICGVIAVPLCYIFDVGALLGFIPVINVLFIFLYRNLFGHDINFNSSRLFTDTILGSIPVNLIESFVGDKKYKYDNRGNEMHSHREHYEGIGVSSIIHASVCRLGWYSGDEFIGGIHDARLVLYEKHLTVHEVGASQNMGNHERVITSERLIGRIQTSRISVSVAVIESNNRRTSTGSGVLQGHVLLISAVDDGPLFDETDNMSNASYLSKQLVLFPNNSYNNSSITNNINTNNSNSNYINNKTNDSKNNNRYNTSDYDGSDVKGSKTKKKSDQGNSSNLNSNNKNGGSSYVGSASFVTNDTDNRIFSRQAIAVKFYSLRDQERWLSLLRASHEAAHWRSYLRTLPTPDAFNLLLTRLLVQSMRTTALGNFIHAKIQKKLDTLSVKKFPRDIEGGIILDDFLLSDEVPIVSNVSSPAITANGEVTFDFDLLYRGGATLCLRFNLTYRGLRIPHVVCAVTIERAAARLRLSVGPPPSKKFWLGLLSPPAVRLEVAPGLSPPARRGPLHRLLAALPDLSPVASQLLRLYLLGEMGLPVMDDYPLPSVEKTPPPTPAGRKRWNTRFDRRNAAARSRSHRNTADTAKTVTGRAVVSSVGSFMDAIKRYTSGLTQFGTSTRDETSPPRETTPTLYSDILHEEESEKKSVVTNVPSEARSVSSTNITTLSGVSPNSEDVRRHRIKAKAEEIMRPAVRTANRLPPPTETNKSSV